VAHSSSARHVVLCSDLLTGYLGAVGIAPGAVLAAGTGAVALGTDLTGTWRRVDGWGHLLGDTGGGAWIGRAGMQAAYRAVDGRPDGSSHLLAALRATHGDPTRLVADLTARADRAGVFAAFAPTVITAAVDDPVAAAIVHRAAGHLADTLLTALPPHTTPTGAVTGNLLRPSSPLTDAFTDAVHTRCPAVILREPAGTPLDGAVTLAAAVLHGPLPAGMADAAALSTLHQTTPC
jgi:N-acetylglucosamine kinase-like BadF-type ATPase